METEVTKSNQPAAIDETMLTDEERREALWEWLRGPASPERLRECYKLVTREEVAAINKVFAVSPDNNYYLDGGTTVEAERRFAILRLGILRRFARRKYGIVSRATGANDSSGTVGPSVPASDSAVRPGARRAANRSAG